MVFPGVQKTTWNYDREAKAWYFHRFYDFQPDLNTSNPEVQAEILKIMGFWIQAGVSGFRMDAVPFIISSKGPGVRKPKEQFDMLRVFRRIPPVAPGRLHCAGGSQCPPGNRHGLLRQRRRAHAHAVQFPGQPTPLLCIGSRRYPPAGQSVEKRLSRGRQRRNGGSFCEIMTNLTWVVCKRSSGKLYLRRLV